MKTSIKLSYLTLIVISFFTQLTYAQVELLNVSYDPTREFYQAFNQAFASYWQNKNGEVIKVNQSHGGSGKQARAVISGLKADVVTLALSYDIDVLHDQGNFIPADWQKRLPHHSSPYTSTIVFLVRKGNPKAIHNWDDLIKDGIEVVTPNPKTSGGARWNYLAAWGYSLQKEKGNQDAAFSFVKKLYQNVKVLDSGARGSLTTFTERSIGDVLIAWENEALLAVKESASRNFEIITPPVSILAQPPVSIVDKVVDKKGTRKVASAYLNYLYSDVGQTLAAKYYYRPTNPDIAKENKAQFPEVQLFTVDEVFGGWQEAQKKHFSDGGTFDRIYQ